MIAPAQIKPKTVVVQRSSQRSADRRRHRPDPIFRLGARQADAEAGAEPLSDLRRADVERLRAATARREKCGCTCTSPRRALSSRGRRRRSISPATRRWRFWSASIRRSSRARSRQRTVKSQRRTPVARQPQARSRLVRRQGHVGLHSVALQARRQAADRHHVAQQDPRQRQEDRRFHRLPERDARAGAGRNRRSGDEETHQHRHAGDRRARTERVSTSIRSCSSAASSRCSRSIRPTPDKTVVSAFVVLGVESDLLEKKKEYDKVPVLRNLVPAQVLSGNSSFNTGNSISAGLPVYARHRVRRLPHCWKTTAAARR